LYVMLITSEDRYLPTKL